MFFIITIILVLQFVPVGAATMADRYTYIPFIGIFFIIGKLYEHLSLHANANLIKYKRYSLIVLVLGFITFSTITSKRVKIWKNDDTLFSDAINKYPNCRIPYLNRGVYFLNYFANIKYINNNFEREKYIKRAIKDFENTLKLTFIPLEKVQVYNNLGIAQITLGDYVNAISYLEKAIKIDPNNANTYNIRGNAKFYLKDYAGALEDYNKVIELKPQDSNAIKNRNSVMSILENSKKL